MSKTRVFIYGSCVSRDTFEHLDPQHFELVHYVARQSALSAYTRPVELVAPPSVQSEFQGRMLAGDFSSSLQRLIPELAHKTDLLLVDLTDERLGVYVLPDGSVITRSNELIESSAERSLPPGTQHLPFGSDQHFQYWSQGIEAIGELIRQHMPRAAVALLDLPWAERSESGAPTPDSFGLGAREANQIFERYSRIASESLGAHVISMPLGKVTSSPAHPWGEAPFHYSEQVYIDVVEQLTGSPGRAVWSSKRARSNLDANTQSHPASGANNAHDPLKPECTPDFVIAGTQRGGTRWLADRLSNHPDISIAGPEGSNLLNRPAGLQDPDQVAAYSETYRNRDRRLMGEVSPTYFWHTARSPFAPTRIDVARNVAQYLDAAAPIIVVLRNPVSRAVSAYWHHFAIGNINPSDGVFQAPPALGIVDLGFYSRHYTHWAETIGEQRITVLLYEDLIARPHDFLRNATRAIGVSDIALDERKLRTREGRRPWLNAIQRKAPLAKQEVAALQALYRDEVAFAEELLGRKLDEWRKPLD